jgi:magnesium chelatase family protein
MPLRRRCPPRQTRATIETLTTMAIVLRNIPALPERSSRYPRRYRAKARRRFARRISTPSSRASQAGASRGVNPSGDEFAEFRRDVLEVLRQPMEDGKITITRTAAAITYPARFMLAAAMNPCECGYYGDTQRPCTCPKGSVARYLNRISGPILDRIDIHIEVPRLRSEELTGPANGERSAAIRERVEKARAIQQARFRGDTAASERKIHTNAHMDPRHLRSYCTLTDDSLALLRGAIEQMGLSARAYDRILKVSRTIADLAGAEQIGIAHIAEAIQYRALDRKFWGR